MKPWWLLVLNFLAQYVVVYLLWQKINGSVPGPGFQHWVFPTPRNWKTC